MLKTAFQKSEPKQLIDRDFKTSILKVSKMIYWKIMATSDRSYEEFDGKFTTVLNKHAPKKKKMASWYPKAPY